MRNPHHYINSQRWEYKEKFDRQMAEAGISQQQVQQQQEKKDPAGPMKPTNEKAAKFVRAAEMGSLNSFEEPGFFDLYGYYLLGGLVISGSVYLAYRYFFPSSKTTTMTTNLSHEQAKASIPMREPGDPININPEMLRQLSNQQQLLSQLSQLQQQQQ